LKKKADKVHPIEACAMLFGKLTLKEAVVARAKDPIKVKGIKKMIDTIPIAEGYFGSRKVGHQAYKKKRPACFARNSQHV